MSEGIKTRLKDGRPVAIRPISIDDEARLRTGITELSDRSRYLRFFSGLKRMPEPVVRRLAAADGHYHVAWGAMLDEGADGRAIGAAHVMRECDVPEAELAFAVIDEFHAQGLARMLIGCCLVQARAEGVRELSAEVLSENAGARRLMRYLGGAGQHAAGPVIRYHVALDTALATLRGDKAAGPLVARLEGCARAA